MKKMMDDGEDEKWMLRRKTEGEVEVMKEEMDVDEGENRWMHD